MALLNNSNLIKQGTSLKEVSQEAFNTAMQTPGQQPGTAAGALRLGANQDQAKMIGTPAQKQKAAKLNLSPTPPQPKPEQTAQQAQRITQPQATDTGAQAKEKMDRLSQLGSIGLRIEGLIQQKLDQAKASQASTVIDTNKIGALPQDKQQQAQQALSDYLIARSTGDQEAIQQALKNVANTLGLSAVDENTINQYFTAQGIEGGFGEQQKVTLGQLDLSEMGGADQIAADLGISAEELANFSFEDFNRAIQDLEAKEFNRVQELEAILTNPATPQEREAALRELRALGYAGQTGSESRFDVTQQQVKEAPEATALKLGDMEFSLQDITQDKELGNLIKNVYNDEATLNEWLNSDDPETKAIAEWIKSNKDSIAATAQEMGQEAKSFRSVQKDMETYRSELPANLVDALFEDEGFLTQAEWEAKKEQLDANTAIQALKANPELQTMVGKDDLQWMQQMSVEDIQQQAELTDRIAGSTALQSLLEDSGIDGTKIINPDDNETVQAALNKYETWGSNDTLVMNKDLMKAFDDGLISDTVRNALIKNPGNVGSVMAVLNFQSEVNDLYDLAIADNKIDNAEMKKLLDTVGLGALASQKDSIAQLYLLASLGNAEAKKKVALLSSFGIDKNGNVVDAEKFKAAILSGKNLDDAAISNKTTSNYTADQFSAVNDPYWNTFAATMKDGKWDANEINSLASQSPANIDNFIKAVGIKNIPTNVLNAVMNKSFNDFVGSSAFNNSSLLSNGILDKDDIKNGIYSTEFLNSYVPPNWRSSSSSVGRVADFLSKYNGQTPESVLANTKKEFDDMIGMLYNDLARAKTMPSVPASYRKNIEAQIANLKKQRDSALKNINEMLSSAVGKGGTISKEGLSEWRGALDMISGDKYSKLDNVAKVNGMYPNSTNNRSNNPNPEAMKRYGVKASNPEKWLWEAMRATISKAYPGDSPASIDNRLHEYFFKPPNGVAVVAWNAAKGKK